MGNLVADTAGIMKKTAAILLLAIYTLIQAIPVCLYHYNTVAHHYFQYLQQRKGVSEYDLEDIVTFYIHKSGLKEVKRSENEIMIGGILYDIENSGCCGDSIKLLLKRDREETNWNEHYKKLNTGIDKANNSSSSKVIKIRPGLLQFYCTNLTSLFLRALPVTNASFNNTAAPNYSNPVIGLIKPPPRMC